MKSRIDNRSLIDTSCVLGFNKRKFVTLFTVIINERNRPIELQCELNYIPTMHALPAYIQLPNVPYDCAYRGISLKKEGVFRI